MRACNLAVPLPVGEPVTTLLSRIERATSRGGSITFIGSEEPRHGLQVFDLRRLRGETRRSLQDIKEDLDL